MLYEITISYKDCRVVVQERCSILLLRSMLLLLVVEFLTETKGISLFPVVVQSG